MSQRIFSFNKPASREVCWSKNLLSLHNFESGEWVVSVETGNQWGEWSQSYLLTEREIPGDPRTEEFLVNLMAVAKNIKSNLKQNEYRRVYPCVCNLEESGFTNGTSFREYSVGEEK